MTLSEYPTPAQDTGVGFHDSADVARRPPDPAGYARYLRQDLGVTWFNVLAGGRNKPDLVAAFTAAGLECPIRLYAPRPHPGYVVQRDDVRAYVDAGAHYIAWGNEPNLVCEWDEASWREGAIVDKVCQQWLRNADVIRTAGGIPLFVALSPGGDYQHRRFYQTAFDWLRLHGHLDSLRGAALAIHNRPLNHPLDYVDRPDEPTPGCHFLDYEWIDALVRQYLGEPLPLLGTEAGYEWRWQQDPRYPEISLELHSHYNLEIVDGFRTGRWAPTLVCQCFWLVAPWGAAGGGFGLAHWHDNRVLGCDLPAVAALRADWAARPFVRQLAGPGAGLPAGLTIADVPTTNYGYPRGQAGRNGYRVIAVVEHTIDGTLPELDAYVQQPSSLVSYHYAVGKDARIHRYVDEADAAWHAGVVEAPTWSLVQAGVTPNLYTIGIGWEGHPGEPLTGPQYEAGLALHRDLLPRWGITPGPETVIGHYRIRSVAKAYCPGPAFPWTQLLTDLGAPGGGVPGPGPAVETVEAAVRNAAWNAGGIAYNREAAFPQYARARELGNPTTGEFDVVLGGCLYRGQGFGRRIVYAEVGRWDDCRDIEW